MENNKEQTPDLLTESEINAQNNATWFQKLIPNEHTRKILIFSFSGLTLLLSIFIFFISILYFVPEVQDHLSGKNYKLTVEKDSIPDPSLKKQLTLVEKDIQKLSKRYNAFTPGLSYIVINTTGNRFSLFSNKKLIREGFCSTGKLTLLKTSGGDKEWVFRTPRGERWIQGKITKPLWSRPDWSFIEEGLPVPPPGDPSRYEYGVLGDYGLSIGNGYLIHGTIYKRFLGMPVTHGCVRLGDEDLKVVYNTLNIGSKVFIF